MTDTAYFHELGAIMTRLERGAAHVVLSAAGVIATWSASLTALLGWTAAEAEGQLLANVCIPPDLRGAHTAGLQRYQETALSSIACKQFRTFALHKDGHTLPVFIDVQMIRDEQQRVRFLGWIRRATPDKGTHGAG